VAQGSADQPPLPLDRLPPPGPANGPGV